MMRLSVTSVTSMLAILVTAAAQTSTSSSAAAACTGNSASTRTEWCAYDINTDYYETVPDTGRIVEYWLEVTNTTLAPDGYSRQVQTINGSIPGPTIEANWGDTIVVHVTNAVNDNGTTIHFHGIRQNYTNQNDGVSSITQCPTAPGESITYTWRATQYGSSWYHSHFSLQAWDGVLGGIVIHGPASSNYDNDLGSLFLLDWTHETADSLYHSAQINGPPTLDNGLINGTNTFNGTVGNRFSTTFVEGESYLLRVVNGAIDTHFDFTIDNHTLLVIASDFVPIEPYSTEVLSIGIGQRYDIVVTADQAEVADSFWMRAVPDAFCSENASQDDIKGIVYYGSSSTTPTTSAWAYDDSDCAGEPAASIVPIVSKTAGASAATESNDVTIGIADESLFKWFLNSVTFNSSWADPTALMVANNVTDFDSAMQVMLAPTAGDWYYLLLETSLAVPHPIHLHGHDFFVLAAGSGSYSSSDATLQLDNPPRRDTTMLPAEGYLVLGFQADNPGIWLMHCHIGWHTEEGLSLQVIERYDEIMDLYDTDELESTCDAWDNYVSESGKTQEDDDGI